MITEHQAAVLRYLRDHQPWANMRKFPLELVINFRGIKRSGLIGEKTFYNGKYDYRDCMAITPAGLSALAEYEEKHNET